ncbi:MAG: 5,10-methylenetetrahydrofolate reductase [Candidatus Acidulodesulfobacterium ferriphilum]|uniref:Methylenetetrahydrofolate reductase n=1 Tax=Candidatus Acidulodesulfobacterium ferriphilum TaxID=2597223 RepID=A0A519B9Z6_9DELT|nr:MAG: 5,10-methylenetetrahydrofolate reductase [Candidatus Acidulodesulfobacterium ferriphilum]
MMLTNFKSGNKLKESLNAGAFVYTSEISPERGTDLSKMKSIYELLKNRITAFNITDNQGANMKMSSLAGSIYIKQAGGEPIFQQTCRDRNRMALESDLLGAAAFQVKNVLALTGDHISFGDHKHAKAVYDIDSANLIEIVKGLNAGADMNGNKLNDPTDFYIGAAVNPESVPLEPQLIKFEKKITAGCDFFQTQAVFSVEKFNKFYDFYKNYKDIKIIAGIYILKSGKTARFMNQAIPGIYIPETLIGELDNALNPVKKGVEIAARIARELKPLVHGIHIMAYGIEDKIPYFLDEFEKKGSENS